MAGDETVAKAKRMVEVWASTTDALLQEWLEKGEANDRLGAAIASVRLAQLSLMMMNYFKEVGENFLQGETEVKAAQQAVRLMDTTVRRAMAAVGVGSSGDTGPVPVEVDPSLN